MNVKNLVLGLGIFIVFLLMLFFGIQTFYSAPKYENYCSQSVYNNPYPVTKPVSPVYGTNCSFNQALEDQALTCSNQSGMPVYKYDSNGCTVEIKECNMCQKQFEDARLDYDKIVFVISLIAGIITLLIGFSILSIEPVGSALMAGGVGAIVIGTARNWQKLGNIWRFLILLAALILLIWIALRMNKNVKGQHFHK